jgi:hypothetical protein
MKGTDMHRQSKIELEKFASLSVKEIGVKLTESLIDEVEKRVLMSPKKTTVSLSPKNPQEFVEEERRELTDEARREFIENARILYSRADDGNCEAYEVEAHEIFEPGPARTSSLYVIQ